MATPIMSLRVLHSQRGVVRAVVKALKRDPKLAARILEAAGEAPGSLAKEAPKTDFLVGRLAAALRPREIWSFGPELLVAVADPADPGNQPQDSVAREFGREGKLVYRRDPPRYPF